MDEDATHYLKLQHMYETAPINQVIRSTIRISQGEALVQLETGRQLWHAGDSLHGSIYFKGLDDAAFFAANSVVFDVFVLTARFELELLAPVTAAQLSAKGTLERREGRKLYARAELLDPEGQVVARGQGLFIASKIRLASVASYRLPD